MFILINFKYIWCIWETKGSDSYVVKQEIDGVSGLKLTSYKLARIFNVDDKLDSRIFMLQAQKVTWLFGLLLF